MKNGKSGKMKLYPIICGRLRCRKNVFVPDVDRNETIEAPIPVFLITHAQGNVLFDTGAHPDAFRDADYRWGGIAKAFQPIGGEESGILMQLRNMGMDPREIRYVVNSHLHIDHAGGNQFFKKSSFLVPKEEIECAKNLENEGKGYNKADWDHPLNYLKLEKTFDIYGDGTLILIPTPGHTLGHQIMLIRLRGEGNFILSGDCVPCRENYLQIKISRNNMDDGQALSSIHKLYQLVSEENAFLIHGHDPLQWKEIRKTPDFYS